MKISFKNDKERDVYQTAKSLGVVYGAQQAKNYSKDRTTGSRHYSTAVARECSIP